MTYPAAFPVRRLRSLGAAVHCIIILMAVTAARADGTDCVVYATDYANSHMGSGDVVGDAVDGGMTGAVAGGAWRGPSGAVRGARAGGALGVLDNLGSMPGGWQALYDTAYQMCAQQTSGINADRLYPVPPLGAPQPGCQSAVTVNAFPLREGSSGSITAGSGRTGCQ